MSFSLSKRDAIERINIVKSYHLGYINCNINNIFLAVSRVFLFMVETAKTTGSKNTRMFSKKSWENCEKLVLKF